MDNHQKIRKAILKAGSLSRAIGILEALGLPPDALDALVAAAGAESELASLKGKSGNKSKLKEGVAEEIKKLLGQNLSLGEIAKRTGKSKTTIWYHSKK